MTIFYPTATKLQLNPWSKYERAIGQLVNYTIEEYVLLRNYDYDF